MDGLIILAVIFLIFRAVTQKMRQVNANAQPSVNQTRRSDEAHKPTTPVNRNVRDAQPQKRATMVSSMKGEGEAVFVPIKPTVTVDNVRRTYAGSMGSTGNEGVSLPGMQSSEGVATCQGMDTCDPALLNGRSQVGVTAQAQEEPPALQVLPEYWTEDELVRGFVMSEILKRPDEWSGRHE